MRRARTRLAPLRSTYATGAAAPAAPQLEPLREGGVAQARVDDARAGHHAQIAVGELLERARVLHQIVVRPARGEDQAQRALEHAGARGVRDRRLGREERVGLEEEQYVP